jgi:hypothetical protein
VRFLIQVNIYFSLLIFNLSVVSLGKFGSFKADDIINKPFGLSYEIIGKRQLRVVSQLDTDTAGKYSIHHT